MKNKKRSNFFPLFASLFAILMVGILIFANAINLVRADPVSGFSYSGLSAVDDGSKNNGSTWSYNSSNSTFTATATGISGRCGDSSGNSSTLTLTNTTGIGGVTLTLLYTLSNGGSYKVNGSSLTTTPNTVNYSLSSGGTVTIQVVSQATANQKATLTVRIVDFVVPVANKTTYFEPGLYGSYTATGSDGVAKTCSSSTGNVSITQSQADDITLVASPDNGYKFIEWLKNGVSVSTNSTYVFKGSDDGATYKPVFTESSNATFLVGTTKYFDLSDAIAATSGNNKKIVVVGEGTVKNGNYTIPSGVTLLIPCNTSYSVYDENTTSNADVNAYTNPGSSTAGCFVRLNLAPKNGSLITEINVEGILNVACKFSLSGQVDGHNGSPSGKYGRLHMGRDSKIVVKSSGKLYAWGFITGEGIVEAKNGSTIFEYMQIKDFRGGNHTKNTYSKVFPFNQYYIQNIEVPLLMYKGANEKLRTGFYISNSDYYASINFIGSGGMFYIPSSSKATDYILKKYDGTTDRLIVETHGTIQLSSVNVNLYVNIQSSKYEMPLTNNITINIVDNSMVTITGQNYTALPGVEINIEKGSTLNIDTGSNLYLFDYDQYDGKNYSGGPGTSYTTKDDDGNNITHYTNVYPVDYSPTKTYTRKEPGDPKMKVEGTVYVKGGLFTSAGNAEIISNSDNPGNIVYTFSTSSQKETVAKVTNGNSVIQIKGAHGTMYTGSEPDTENVTFYLASLKNLDKTYRSIRQYYLELDDDSEGRNGENTFSYSATQEKWIGAIGGSVPYRLKLVDPAHSSFVVEYPRDGVLSSSKVDFPTRDEILEYINEYYLENENYDSDAFKDGSNEILFWKAGGTYYPSGEESSESIGLKTMDIECVFGGWVNVDDHDRYLFKSTTLTRNYAKGLYKAETFIEGTADYPIFKLDTDGNFDSMYIGPFSYDSNIYESGDNRWYFIESGIVRETEGLFEYDSKYYYVTEDNYLLTDGIYYINKMNDITDIEAGYYSFSANGVMDEHRVDNRPTTIVDFVAYVSYEEGSDSNVVASNYGLFVKGGFLYYAGNNGELIRGMSFYVNSEKINNCKIGTESVKPGLYYFDSNGRMHDENLALITNGDQ